MNLRASRAHTPRWRLGRGAAAVAVFVGILGGLVAPAAAHAQLESTEPAAGAMLAKSPGRIVLHFGETVELQLGSIRVFDAAGKRVDSGTANHSPGDPHAVEIKVPSSLPAGGYVVTWRVISADSHPVHGAFTFQIGTTSTGGAALRNEAAGLLSQSAGSKTVGIAFGVIRFLVFASLALLIGGALFVTVIWPPGRAERRARRLLWWALAAAAAATVAGFALQGPYGAGLGLGSALKPSVVSGVWHTRFGHVYVARLALLALAAFVLGRLLRRPPDERIPVVELVVAGAVAAALVATPGLAGHAATGSLVALAVPFDIVHVGGASVWFGGLVMVLLVVLPASRREAGHATSPLRLALPRFSQWALGAVIAIAISGGFAAWRQIGTLGAATTTPYGRVVVAKTAVFAVVLAVAAVSRSAVHGNLAIPGLGARQTRSGVGGPAPALSEGPGAMAVDPGTGGATKLRPAVGVEVVLIAVVLALSAALVNAQPAKQAYAKPFSTEVHAGPNLVDVTIDPAKAGPLAFHVYILTADGAQLDVPEVDATMSQASAGIEGLKVPLTKAGPGHFVASGFDVPIPGTWTVNILVRTSDIDEYNAQPFTVHIR